jgi:hypothetical protein
MAFTPMPLGPRQARSVTLERGRRSPMYRRMPLDLFEQWLPTRPVLLLALGIWSAGFALAGATAWRMHHKTTMGTEETNGSALPVSDSADFKGAVLMPEDAIVGVRTPRLGVTQSQKP